MFHTFRFLQKMSDSSSNSSSSTESKVANLRKQLSSIAWVQCDLSNCMKWRKVDKAVADKLTSDTWWECSMNEDRRFNACNVPEEDIQSFDKLAQRAKLNIFKSELTPGSLVWAKTPGYCIWPALVTEDPANGEFWEGEEDEPGKGHYHVEFLGHCPCHLWVYAKSVELFGEGNSNLVSQKSEKMSKDQQNARKRKRTKAISHSTKREKRSYGGGSVEVAIKEAVKLLPLSQEDRLKVCRFVRDTTNKVVESKSVDGVTKHNKSKRGRPAIKNNYKAQRSKRQRLDKNSNANRRSLDYVESEVDDTLSQHSSEGKDDISSDFLTSLLDVSKEERFFLDISIHKEKKRRFRDTLENFCSQYGLPLETSSFVWDDTKVNFFDFFSIVDDRGGFEEVSRSRQWSHVYYELTNYPSRAGAKKAKSAYKKYLHPFELYINDKDPSSAINYVKKRCKPLKQIERTKMPSLGKDGSESGESDLDDADFIQALDELDDLLHSLQQKGSDGVVPDLYDNAARPHPDCDEDVQGAWDATRVCYKFDHLRPTTGSQPCMANEPEESAQVVPEMDFPSISESTATSGEDVAFGLEEGEEEEDNMWQLQLQPDNEEEWVLQELQALEHDI